MTIQAAIRHQLGPFSLDVSFESRGSLTAVFGASGSGKTTVVNAIAGLLRPDYANIKINGDALTDTEQSIQVPAHRRRIGYVFQDARLFPHLTVEQNLRYGQWFRAKGDRYAEPASIVSLLGIEHLLSRRPNQLSGGEKQRVAIGRALLASPRLLLMDEPLASLDQPRRAEILPYIERLRDEFRIPIIYVSHSIAEVVRLATDMVVLSNGRCVAYGATEDIAQRLDLVPLEERDEGGAVLDMSVASYDAQFDMTLLQSEPGDAYVPGKAGNPGDKVRVRIRARDVMIAVTKPQGISALNSFSGTVAELAEADRASVVVRIDCGGIPILARITRQSCAALQLAAGKQVYAVVKAMSVAGPTAAPL
jgi:molybdate transport system ATP-binding protein